MDSINNPAGLRAQAERLRRSKHYLWGCPLALMAMGVQWWMVGSLRVVAERGSSGMWTVLILLMVGGVGLRMVVAPYNAQLAHLRQDYHVNHGKPRSLLGGAQHVETRYDYDRFTLQDFDALRKRELWSQWTVGAFCALLTWATAVEAIYEFVLG